LLFEVFRWAGFNGISQVKAEVVKGNTRALRFYEKFGFVASDVGAFESASSWLLIKRVDLENP